MTCADEGTTRGTTELSRCCSVHRRHSAGVLDACLLHMEMDYMMGPWMMVLMVVLLGAVIAALIALTVFLVRRSR
jgi:hypothetical protein